MYKFVVRFRQDTRIQILLHIYFTYLNILLINLDRELRQSVQGKFRGFPENIRLLGTIIKSTSTVLVSIVKNAFQVIGYVRTRVPSVVDFEPVKTNIKSACLLYQ